MKKVLILLSILYLTIISGCSNKYPDIEIINNQAMIADISNFEITDYVRGKDYEDGDVSENIQVIDKQLIKTEISEYDQLRVEMTVKDSNGNITEKVITFKVKKEQVLDNDNSKPVKPIDNSDLKEGEYWCMGKNDTCQNKTKDPFDFYCRICDKNNDNIED